MHEYPFAGWYLKQQLCWIQSPIDFLVGPGLFADREQATDGNREKQTITTNSPLGGYRPNIPEHYRTLLNKPGDIPNLTLAMSPTLAIADLSWSLTCFCATKNRSDDPWRLWTSLDLFSPRALLTATRLLPTKHLRYATVGLVTSLNNWSGGWLLVG